MSPVIPFRRDSDILDRIRKQGGRTSADTQYLQLVLVDIGGASFAIDALKVAEILVAPAIITVPSSHPLLSGVVNIRGNIIPVFDPASRIGVSGGRSGEAVGEENERRLVVFRADEGLLAMTVDDVTLRLSHGRVAAHPPEGAVLMAGCARLAEIGEKMLPLLEIEVLLSADERKALVDVKKSF